MKDFMEEVPLGCASKTGSGFEVWNMVDQEDISGEGYGTGTCVKVRGLGTAVETGLMEHVACKGEWWERCLDRASGVRIWKASAARERSLSSLVGHGMPLMVSVPRSITIEKINP